MNATSEAVATFFVIELALGQRARLVEATNVASAGVDDAKRLGAKHASLRKRDEGRVDGDGQLHGKPGG